MPGGARNKLLRSSRALSHNEPTRALPPAPSLQAANLPKHSPFYNVMAVDSDLFFEFILAICAITGAALQFLYLYRAIWWLPNSYNHTTMHFYLIDANLVVLIIVIFLRRFYYQLGCKIILKIYSTKTEEDLSCFSRTTLLLFYGALIGILSTIVLGNRNKIDIAYLFYPIILYLPIFGFKIRPFFEASSWCSNGIQPIHACSSSPFDIRRECTHLRANLFDRLRQIFFTASINTYYGSFIPVCFSQSELVYDRWWNIEHGIIIFWGTFTYCFTHLISLRYYDVLHRAILHSGYWEKIELDRNSSLVIHEWRDDVLWPEDSIVKYNKLLWKGMGECNCIYPGDRILTWCYKTFKSHLFVTSIAATFQMILVLYLVYLQFNAVFWYRILAIILMSISNYVAFYKLVRDTRYCYTFYAKPIEKFREDVAPAAAAAHQDSLNTASSSKHYRSNRNNLKFKAPTTTSTTTTEFESDDDDDDDDDEDQNYAEER